MPKLTIVASITAHPDKIDLVNAELTKLIDPTRAEPGCLQYDLHQNNEDPTHFLFYENWQSRDHWLAHMDTEHIAAFKANTDNALKDFTLYEMTHTA